MDSVLLMDRVETKFAMRESLLTDLLVAVADEYRVLEVAGGRLSDYSTLYFDTLARDCYRDHHNGRLHRHKYRMRSYGSSGPAFFEVKRKTNKGRTIKRRIPIAAIRPMLAGDAAMMAYEAAGQRLDLAPQMWTYFSRITLVGHETAERVTLDVDLQFADSRQRRAALPGIAIVEVKQERHSRHSPIRQQLREMRVASLRISKYCIGSALLDPGLKRNRFKPNVRALATLSQ